MENDTQTETAAYWRGYSLGFFGAKAIVAKAIVAKCGKEKERERLQWLPLDGRVRGSWQ